MRIRRSAKLSPALSTADGTCPEELLQAHVCRLSQSPWDIAIVAQSSANTQREGRALEDWSFTRNGSLGGDSIGAVESVTSSMMDIGEDDNGTETTIMPAKRRRRKKTTTTTTKTTAEAAETIVIDNGNGAAKKSKKSAKQISKGNNGNVVNNGVGLCQKNDGKGWQCKRAAKEGSNFCEHHLSLFRSYNNSNSTANYNTSLGNGGGGGGSGATMVSSKQKSSAAAVVAEVGSVRRTRGAAAGRRPNPSNANPYEFYYYSGFGPRWGRKRGGGRGRSPDAGGVSGGEDDGDEGSKLVDGGDADSSPSPSPRSSSTTTGVADGGGNAVGGNSELDYVEDEDEDEDEDIHSGGDGGGRKRVRRPVKARSLKSLM